MRSVSSDITWLSKSGPKNQTTGHVSSLNRVLEEVVDDFDYLVFLEDDFFFIQDEDYISKALNIFAQERVHRPDRVQSAILSDKHRDRR